MAATTTSSSAPHHGIPTRTGVRDWFRALVATTSDVSPLVARLGLGVVMFPHGAQKLLGWFGGYGFDGTMGFFTGKMGIPAVFAVLAIVAEFFGSIGLLLGVLSRIAAFGIGAVMLVAVALVHSHVGFFMNWAGAQAGEGFEYHLLALALVAIVMVKGAGPYSVDRWLAARRAQGE